jgi:hypothetical protein
MRSTHSTESKEMSEVSKGQSMRRRKVEETSSRGQDLWRDITVSISEAGVGAMIEERGRQESTVETEIGIASIVRRGVIHESEMTESLRRETMIERGMKTIAVVEEVKIKRP